MVNEITNQPVVNSYFEPDINPNSIVVEVKDLNISTVINNMENQKLKEMEVRLKASLAADFDAKYGSIIENVSTEIYGLKGENSCLKRDMDGLKGENSCLKRDMDGLKEFCSSIAEITIINVAGEIMLFCIHEQPKKQPKKVNIKDFKVNSAKLNLIAKSNVEKMKQKFGHAFIQDSQTIIECRNSRVHYSGLEL